MKQQLCVQDQNHSDELENMRLQYQKLEAGLEQSRSESVTHLLPVGLFAACHWQGCFQCHLLCQPLNLHALVRLPAFSPILVLCVCGCSVVCI